MKGLILCAGKGSRLQPLSFSQPKTLLPIANKPVLFYCIENLVSHGINEIGIVIHPTQQSIIERVGNGNNFKVKITYIYQRELKGIGHAIQQAREFIADEPFILMLGDNLVMEPLHNLIDAYHSRKQINASILLAEVDNPQDFGIATIKDDKIIKVVEKPKYPETNLAVIGVYIFDQYIFEAVSSISPSVRGEYEISDAIQWLINNEFKITFSRTVKKYFDVGTVERWLKANRWKLEDDLKNDNCIGKNVTLNNCRLRGPVIIGDNCSVINTDLGPYVSIEPNTKISGCNIKNSIILEGTSLQNITGTIANSVFGRNSQLEGMIKSPYGYQFVLGDKSKMKLSSQHKREKE